MDPRRSGQRSYAQLDSNDAVVSRLAQQDKISWYNKPNLRLLYLLMFPTCLGVEMTSGFDASMVNGLQAVSSWLEYYHHPHSASLGLMASMYSLGGIAAVPFVSPIVDKIGRRYPILLGGIISITGGIVQGSATNFTMFIIGRFILGFANVFCVVAASSLIGAEELSHPKERVVISGLYNSTWDLGAVISAAVTLGTFAMTSNWAWRIPSFLQIFPSLLQVSFIWFMPESPRWLISKGRGSEAYAILVKYHAEGDEDSEFVKAEYSQIEQTLEAEMKIAKMSKVFSTPGMRKRVIIATSLGLFTQWCGISLITSYLVLVLDGIGIHDNRMKNVVNLAKFSWSCFNGAVLALIVPRYPRRKIYLACTISVFVVFTAFTVANAEYSLTHNKVAAQVVLALIFLYSPAYNMGFTSTYSFLVELFPFHVRTGGIAIFQWWSRCAAFLGQFVNSVGMDAAGWRWYIVYCVWNAFQVVFVYLVFPETSGRTLEELTFLYEDDQQAFRHAEAEMLQGPVETSTYGTVEGDRGRTGRDV